MDFNNISFPNNHCDSVSSYQGFNFTNIEINETFSDEIILSPNLLESKDKNNEIKRRII